MKLLFYVVDDESDKTECRDIHINPSKIDAFYMPDLDADGIKCINIFMGGQLLTVVQNQEIIDYLTYKFNL